MKKYILSMLGIIFLASNIKAQTEPIYSLHDAIALALKNNYGILMAKNDADIAANNVYLGNAGALPQLTLNASESYSSNNVYQVYADNRPPIDKTGIGTNVIGATANLNWTLFDGFKMFATYGRLQQLKDAGDIAFKINIENALAKVIMSYYDISRQQQLINANNEAIKISEDRISLAQTKLDIGSGSKLELLQAKVDKNAQVALLLQQHQAMNDAKNNLNLLLGMNLDNKFGVNDSIELSYQPTLDELRKTLPLQNNTLLLAERNKSIASYAVKEAESFRYPKLSFISSYGDNKSSTQAGFILTNNLLGYSVGLVASMTVFDGFNINHRVRNAKISMLSADLQYNITRLTQESSLLSAFQNLKNNLALLKMEQENFLLAKENLDIALVRFKLGSASALDLKAAQSSYTDSEARLVTARYNAKLSETDLKRLNGDLIK
jgi:outer membrane protein